MSIRRYGATVIGCDHLGCVKFIPLGVDGEVLARSKAAARGWLQIEKRDYCPHHGWTAKEPCA